ncbi:Lipid-A-disaccharide synthase [Granulicella sibirica]|uniref:Lipid-A-disaccharide synthase n=2 Tax=Granulicella sibirica TaxID=2479048 RepID=A0A4Q0SY99_9BACT|nr:Lipid-A-disaccharide synthase [Granulicella sibirica]
MEAAGQRRVIRAEDVAVMGITEILRHIPHIYASYRKLVAAIKAERPAAAILIDFPDVNFRLAKHCKRLGIPVLWFVSPQLWAWKRRRLRWVQQRVDRMLVIFPFEAQFYRARNVDAEFVGHPLASLPLPTSPRSEYASRYDLDPTMPWIALLPGSRWKEIRLNLPEMLDTAVRLPDGAEYLLPVATTIDREQLQHMVTDQLESRHKEVRPSLSLPTIRLVPDAREALHHARASLVASGTATVQALLIGNPFVVVYRVSPTTFALAKLLVAYPREIPAPKDDHGNLPIAMVNLIAGRRIVPEFINQHFNSANVAPALTLLLADSPRRAAMLADLAQARATLLPPANSTPIERVADAVDQLLNRPSK